MASAVISHVSRDFDLFAPAIAWQRGGLKHIPMTMIPMMRITFRYQQATPLSMLLSIIRRALEETLTINLLERSWGIRFSASERSDDNTHLPTTINSWATILNVIVDHMYIELGWWVQQNSNSAVGARMSCVNYCRAHIFRCSLKIWDWNNIMLPAFAIQDRITPCDEGQGRCQRDYPQLGLKVCLGHHVGRWQDSCWL